jgi:hypothetical protein
MKKCAVGSLDGVAKIPFILELGMAMNNKNVRKHDF